MRPADAFATEVRAWAIMGMNVFLGLRFGVWGDEDAGNGRGRASTACCGDGLEA